MVVKRSARGHGLAEVLEVDQLDARARIERHLVREEPGGEDVLDVALLERTTARPGGDAV